MTTDKLSAGQRAHILRMIVAYTSPTESGLHAKALHDADLLEEAARREGVETKPAFDWMAERDGIFGRPEPTPAPPADERERTIRNADAVIDAVAPADAVWELVSIRSAIPACFLLDPPDGGDVLSSEGVKRIAARIAELERERDELREAILGGRPAQEFARFVGHGNYIEAARGLHAGIAGGLARAEAAEAREKEVG
jgi:hypothetical protein